MLHAYCTDSALNDRRDVVGMLPDDTIEVSDAREVGRFVNRWMRRNGRPLKGCTDATGRAVLARVKRGEVVNLAAGNGHILVLLSAGILPDAGWEDSVEANVAAERAALATADHRRIMDAVEARASMQRELGTGDVLTIEA